MPVEQVHVALAKRNKDALKHLAACSENPHVEWRATIAFYTALQIVEASIARQKGRHFTGHGERHDFIKKDRHFSKVWEHYRPLYAASLVARYLADVGKGQYSEFTDYMSESDVENVLIGVRLSGVYDFAKDKIQREQARSLGL